MRHVQSLAKPPHFTTRETSTSSCNTSTPPATIRSPAAAIRSRLRVFSFVDLAETRGWLGSNTLATGLGADSAPDGLHRLTHLHPRLNLQATPCQSAVRRVEVKSLSSSRLDEASVLHFARAAFELHFCDEASCANTTNLPPNDHVRHGLYRIYLLSIPVATSALLLSTLILLPNERERDRDFTGCAFPRLDVAQRRLSDTDINRQTPLPREPSAQTETLPSTSLRYSSTSH